MAAGPRPFPREQSRVLILFRPPVDSSTVKRCLPVYKKKSSARGKRKKPRAVQRGLQYFSELRRTRVGAALVPPRPCSGAYLLVVSSALTSSREGTSRAVHAWILA